MTAGYVFGPYVDEVLAMRRDVDNNGTLETFYYLHDDQFNVIALTDAAGNVVERYEYGDFGDPTIYDAAGVERPDKTSAFGNVYMFQGRPYDAETGLYYFRTRYLDPVQGRFISRDTIGVWGDANNLGNPYTFVGNNPWTNLDPYGLWAWDGDWIQYGVGGLLGLQGREVFAEGVSEMHTDAAKGVKGMVWTGPKNAVVGVATVVIHPIETMEGARDFAYAAYNDFGGTAAAIGDSIAAAATNPESIGAFTFDIMAGVATGGAAKASSAGSVGKLTNMVKRIDWADNRGMALNPFAKGALTKADGRGVRTNFDFYETIAEVPVKGTTRKAHRASANKNLYNKLSQDTEFMESVEKLLGPGVMKQMKSGKGKGLVNPTDTQWHHPVENPGVMRLLRRSEHENPLLQGALHPGPKGQGGFGLNF